MDTTVQEIDELALADVLGAAAGPVVVEFFATWCGNCRRLASTLDRIAAQSAQHVRFVKINVDDNPDAVKAYEVSSTPTLITFVRGRPVGSPLVGAHPEQTLRDWLDAALQTGTSTPGRADDWWVAADACTLPSAEQPLRVGEFVDLFTTSLHRVQRLSPAHLRLELDSAAEQTARDLAAREADCCEFFTFTVAHTGPGTVRMDIEVPGERRDVLDGLANQALAAQVT